MNTPKETLKRRRAVHNARILSNIPRKGKSPPPPSVPPPLLLPKQATLTPIDTVHLGNWMESAAKAIAAQQVQISELEISIFAMKLTAVLSIFILAIVWVFK